MSQAGVTRDARGRLRSTKTLAERLCEKASPEPNTGCWLWTGQSDQFGYGTLAVRGRTRKAHRLAWEVAYGPLPKIAGHHGAVVRHRCNLPGCVNPAHLVIGSQRDNLQDMSRAGRSTRGERSHLAVLTEGDVREILRLSADGVKQRIIGAKFGVTQGNVSAMVCGLSWRHVSGAP
jgi:hypothetical protein